MSYATWVESEISVLRRIAHMRDCDRELSRPQWGPQPSVTAIRLDPIDCEDLMKAHHAPGALYPGGFCAGAYGL